MLLDDSSAPARRWCRCPDVPRFELCFGAVFTKVALVVLLVGEYKVWRLVRIAVPPSAPGRRVLGFLFYTPRAVFAAFAIGAILTVMVDLVFRLVVKPLMVLWYHPRNRDPFRTTDLCFRLAAGETVLAEIPARRMDGRHRRPGTFVGTDRRIGFYPYAWDGEPWELDLHRLREVRIEPTVRRVLGCVRGYPDHLVLRGDDSAGEIALIVADPDALAAALGGMTPA
jgi:hypothetical protein